MRILIYSETDEAKALLAELREAGHHASLHNPQYFEKADLACETVYADDEHILNAYQSAGIAAHRITASATEPVSETEPEVEPTPKRKRK